MLFAIIGKYFGHWNHVPSWREVNFKKLIGYYFDNLLFGFYFFLQTSQTVYGKSLVNVKLVGSVIHKWNCDLN